jgi:hypothetical protein
MSGKGFVQGTLDKCNSVSKNSKHTLSNRKNMNILLNTASKPMPVERHMDMLERLLTAYNRTVLKPFMNRDTAIVVLKEIFDKLPHLPASSICLMPLSVTGAFEGGYQIHITATVDNADEAIVEDLVARHGLKLRIRENRLVIYKPVI